MCECCTPKNITAHEAEDSVRPIAEQSDRGCGCDGACGCGEAGNTPAEDREPKRQLAQIEQPVAALDRVSA